MREWTCLKVTGASEERRGERLAGDRSHLVTIETRRRHDNGSTGLVEDAQRQWGASTSQSQREMWVGKRREASEGGGVGGMNHIFLFGLLIPLTAIWIH